MFFLISVTETAPKIAVANREYRIKKGEDVNIQVKYISTPSPKEEWTVNGKVVQKSKRVS